MRQYSLLQALSGHEGCSVRALAQVVNLDRSTMTRSLKALLAEGYVSEAKEPGARDSALHLTERGRAVRARAAGLWHEAQERFECVLGAERLSALADALEAMRRL